MSSFSIFEEALERHNKCSKIIKVSIEKCLHDSVIEDSGVVLCMNCGTEIKKDITYDKDWRYYGKFDTKNSSDPTRVHLRKEEDKNIYKDISKMNFNHKIITLANQIYKDITKGKIKRGKSRKSIIFACVYEAYVQSDDVQIPGNLIQVFNITRKEGLQGKKFLELRLPKKKMKNYQITPVHLIKDILNKFEANESQVEEVICLYNMIKNRHTLLNRARPQSVAAGLTFYWFQKESIDMSIKEFSKKVNLSELTISKICDIIKSILE